MRGMGMEDYEKLKKQLLEYENKIAMLSMELQRLKPKNAINANTIQSSYSIQKSSYQQNVFIIFFFQFEALEQEDVEFLKRKVNDLLCLIVLMSAELDQLRNSDYKR